MVSHSCGQYRLGGPIPVVWAQVCTGLTQGDTGYGLASSLNFPVAGKTGTTNNLYDGWFAGYSSRLLTVVWVGQDEPNKPLTGQGAATAGPVWANYMALAENGTRPPAGLHLYAEGGREPDGNCGRYAADPTTPAMYEWFLKATQPRAVSPIQFTGTWTLSEEPRAGVLRLPRPARP